MRDSELADIFPQLNFSQWDYRITTSGNRETGDNVVCFLNLLHSSKQAKVIIVRLVCLRRKQTHTDTRWPLWGFRVLEMDPVLVFKSFVCQAMSAFFSSFE